MMAMRRFLTVFPEGEVRGLLQDHPAEVAFSATPAQKNPHSLDTIKE
jgi:hypothetical protein